VPLHFELALEDLQHYQGTNPCPEDFREFWDRALTELGGIAPCPEWVLAEFQTSYAKCFDLYYTGTRGARVHAKVLKPTEPTDRQPALLMFHGYAASSGDWMEKLPYVASGFTVAAMDCRGQGGESNDPGGVTGWTLRGHIVRGLADHPDALYYRQVFLDTVRLAHLIMELPEVDEQRVAVLGRSQGAALALACAALEPRIWRVAALYPFLCDYKRVWQLDVATNAYEELREYFRRFDPLHDREDEVFKRLGYIDVQHLCPAIQGDVLMAIGLMDTVCPPSTQFAAYNRISSKKKLLLYPDFGHEKLPSCADDVFRFLTG